MASKAITVGKEHSGCPYLGTKNDPNTRFVYPSQKAACHAQTEPVNILLGHQETHCFTDKHVECPIYIEPVKTRTVKRRLFGIPILLLAGIALVLLLILVTFALLRTGDEQEAIFVDVPSKTTVTVTVTSTVSTQPAPTASPDPLFSGSFDQTAEPTSLPVHPATDTVTPTPTSEPTTTSSPTLTPIRTSSPTATSTSTHTVTPMSTNTPTATSTATHTVTPVSTSTPTATLVPAFPTTGSGSPFRLPPPTRIFRPTFPIGSPSQPASDQPTATKISLNP